MSDLGSARQSHNMTGDGTIEVAGTRQDSPTLMTSPTPISSSPSVPPGRTNSAEILTETPVGGSRPTVETARDVTVSVNWDGSAKLEIEHITEPYGEDHSAM